MINCVLTGFQQLFFRNKVLFMSLSCWCFGEEASQKHESESKIANRAKIDPESESGLCVFRFLQSVNGGFSSLLAEPTTLGVDFSLNAH